MRREHRLDAGTHWVYATGSIGGPVVYNILKIREMQIQRTSDAVEKEDVQRNSRPSQHAKTQAHSTHQAALSEYFDLTLDAKRNLMKLCAFIFKPSSYYSMIFFAGTLVATTTVAFVFVMRTILKELDIKPSLPSLPSINLPFKKRSVQTANI